MVCPTNKPICLYKNKNTNQRIMTKNCNDIKPYVPIERIESFLKTIQNNSSPEQSDADAGANCYADDLAWLAIMSDVEHRFDEINKGLSLERLVKVAESVDLDTPRPNIDLKEIFIKILAVAKNKWGIKDDGEGASNEGALKVYEEFTTLINSDNFVKFSNSLTSIKSKDLTDAVIQITKINIEEIKAELPKVKKLFTFSKYCMNNGDQFKDISIVNAAKEDLVEVTTFLNQLSTMKGGKLRKTHKRKQKVNKRGRKNRRKTRRNKILKGGSPCDHIIDDDRRKRCEGERILRFIFTPPIYYIIWFIVMSARSLVGILGNMYNELTSHS